MTLCIAAICDGNDESNGSKIVLCSDLEKETEGVGASETEDKLGMVRSGWPVLCAGVISSSNALVNVYAGYLEKNFDKITEFTLMDHLRVPAHVQKAKLVDHYLQQSFSFNRAYFYGQGKSKLPEEFVARQQDAISRIKLEASLIICGFMDERDYVTNTVNKLPFICVVDDTRSSNGVEEVMLEYEYDAIGSGSATALSMLYRREQDSTDSLASTLYNVYEANGMSDKVPGVGKSFINLAVLYRDGHLEAVTEDGYKYLKKQFTRFGPKRTKEDSFTVNSGFLEPYDFQTNQPPTPSQQVT
ncbi:MAG TPA: hypothetical protein VGL89_03095 [Candidatus Koribacter sp.]|jgi:hypothetical protein